MLSLDSPRWNELCFCNCNGAEFVEYLRELSPNDEFIESEFWQAVCHQGTVYSGSIAAVPHLVQAAENAEHPDLREWLLILVALVCEGRVDYRGKIPADIQTWYEESLPKALKLSLKSLEEATDRETAIYMLMASAALKGLSPFSRILEGVNEGEIPVNCPGCKKEILVLADKGGLHISDDDGCLEPGPPPGSSWENAYSWVAGLASTAIMEDTLALLPSLFGEVKCPHCKTRFMILDQC